MVKLTTKEFVEKLALPILDEVNFELVDIEYKKEGGHWYLRFYIDKPGGITIDDCQIFSEKIGEVLDKEDPIPHSYYLEVSSPGLDRPLKKDSDFKKYTGTKVDVHLYKPVHGKKKHTGVLAGFSDDEIIISVDNNELSFNRSDISVVRLAVEF